ncbi:unnamed protein product [Eruca vesicaria subsp. sativa]|uniref:Uncharacterized protein n=1 Tax=Eruca vesicaria subsp. sativa TaxID=29727 RepID=A0ABC8M2F5_ERUVS|nr:unnamed protein product [Eruca vesicaria subsp. sativa]
MLSVSDNDKYHLFTWTDERIVEEVEDLKLLLCDLKEEFSETRTEVGGLAKQLVQSQHIIDMSVVFSG